MPYRILVYCVLISACWCALAGAQIDNDKAEAEAAVVGEWQGTGMGSFMKIKVKNDHTFSDEEEPNLSGTWSYSGGKFIFNCPAGKMEATMDEGGRLLMTFTDTPGLEIEFEKKGAARREAKALGIQAAPTGEWRFASVKKTSINAGPPFDGITFMEKKVKLTFTPVGKEFESEYQIGNNLIILPLSKEVMFNNLMNFMPLGFRNNGGHKLGFRWEDHGNELVITNAQAVDPFKCEWVFLRPESFIAPPPGFVGRWVGKGSAQGDIMEMRADGTWGTRDKGLNAGTTDSRLQSPAMYYRLWKSPVGNAMTLVQLAPDMQLTHVQMAAYEVKGGSMILTPLGLKFDNKLQAAEGSRSEWKLMALPGSEVSAAAAGKATSAADIIGKWEGKNGDTKLTFEFRPDRTLLWDSTDPLFKRDAPKGLQGRFKVSEGKPFTTVNLHHFQGEEMKDRDIDGIIEKIDDDTLRFEIGNRGRLTEFSIEAIELKRVGSKPALDAATLARLEAESRPGPVGEPPYRVEPLPREAITLPGGVKLALVRVPAGRFMMGQNSAEKYNEAGPAHTVTINYAFEIGMTEVTQAQWKAVMGIWPMGPAENGRIGPIPKASQGDDMPAFCLSPQDCQQFIMKLNQHIATTGQGMARFRLPSEAEWEYACRAGTTTAFYWGDDPYEEEADKYMWHGGNSDIDGQPYMLHAVAQLRPNAWGLFDMSGNAEEWCADDWHKNYEGATRPNDGAAWIENEAGNRKNKQQVRRGGGASSVVRAGKCAERGSADKQMRDYNTGLRLVRTVPQAK